MLTLDSFELAQEALERKDARAIKTQGFSASVKAQAIIQKHYQQALEITTDRLSKPVNRQADMYEVLTLIGPEILALVALHGTIAAMGNDANVTLTRLALGGLAEDEHYAYSLLTHDEKLARRLEMVAKKRNSSVKHRKTAIRAMAKKNGFKFGSWSSEQSSQVGQWLLDIALTLDCFVFIDASEDPKGEGYVTLSEDALTYADEFARYMVNNHPVALPLTSAPPKWRGMKLHVPSASGRKYGIDLVRTWKKPVKARLKAAIEAGTMKPVLDSLDRIGAVPWRVNTDVLDIVLWAQQESPTEVPGLPSRNNVPLPAPITDDEWEALSADQKRLRKKDIGRIKTINRSLIGERLIFERDMTIALNLRDHDGPFYTPANMDYRGRVYFATNFNFQRQDYIRSLFLFDEGKPLGVNGLYWLAIHLANCGDFGKVSKKPFADRSKWTMDNLTPIFQAAADPHGTVAWWSQADKPFMFLAACIEFTKAYFSPNPEEYVCHLPVSWDGSCSGLQHLAAMTRCETTAALVNVSPTDMPQDVYQTVADKVRLAVEALTNDEKVGAVATCCLNYGITRSLVKRNVMTFAYSSAQFGMTNQLKEDTMLPLADEVTRGKRPSHPFRVEGDKYDGQQAAKLLGGLTYRTIKATVEKPAKAMEFLQKIAKALAHEGKPTIWHTPLGLPVVLYYPQMETTIVNLTMMDKGVKRRIGCRLDNPTASINKRTAANAIAPCFVHSMDACHLQMVVNESCKAGITNVALVHDSFGCHPSECDMFRTILKHTFCYLYDGNDVLSDILEEARSQLDTNHEALPALPEKGSLDIRDVLNADYAFA